MSTPQSSKKPAAKRTTKADTTTALPVNKQKQAISERILALVAADVKRGRAIKGVTRDFYAEVAMGQLNYLPGVRQGLVAWPFGGKPSGAGAVQSNGKRKAKPAAKKTAATRKPASRGVTTRSTRKPAARTSATPRNMPQRAPSAPQPTAEQAAQSA